jgi:hypothetical protein
METVSSSETLVHIYQTTQCNIPEDSHIQTYISTLIIICLKFKIAKQILLTYYLNI